MLCKSSQVKTAESILQKYIINQKSRREHKPSPWFFMSVKGVTALPVTRGLVSGDGTFLMWDKLPNTNPSSFKTVHIQQKINYIDPQYSFFIDPALPVAFRYDDLLKRIFYSPQGL